MWGMNESDNRYSGTLLVVPVGGLKMNLIGLSYPHILMRNPPPQALPTPSRVQSKSVHFSSGSCCWSFGSSWLDLQLPVPTCETRQLVGCGVIYTQILTRRLSRPLSAQPLTSCLPCAFCPSCAKSLIMSDLYFFEEIRLSPHFKHSHMPSVPSAMCPLSSQSCVLCPLVCFLPHICHAYMPLACHAPATPAAPHAQTRCRPLSVRFDLTQLADPALSYPASEVCLPSQS